MNRFHVIPCSVVEMQLSYAAIPQGDFYRQMATLMTIVIEMHELPSNGKHRQIFKY